MTPEDFLTSLEARRQKFAAILESDRAKVEAWLLVSGCMGVTLRRAWKPRPFRASFEARSGRTITIARWTPAAAGARARKLLQAETRRAERQIREMAMTIDRFRRPL